MNEPTTGEAIEDRKAQREKIAALFKAHPLETIQPDVLKAVTPHYQQRISECRRIPYWMNIENIPQSIVLADGRKKKIDGAYRYLPYQRLGRDAGVPTLAPWNQDRPFAEGFKLT